MTDEAIKRLEEMRAPVNATDIIWLITELEVALAEIERLRNEAILRDVENAAVGSQMLDLQHDCIQEKHCAEAAEKDAVYQRRHRKWALHRAVVSKMLREDCGHILKTQIARAEQAEVERDLLALRVKVLENVVDSLLDGFDANADERCGLSDEQWKVRIAEARAALGEGTDG